MKQWYSFIVTQKDGSSFEQDARGEDEMDAMMVLDELLEMASISYEFIECLGLRD